jgi:hypothetical protein
LVQCAAGTAIVLPRAGLDMKGRTQLTPDDLQRYVITNDGLFEISMHGIYRQGVTHRSILERTLPALTEALASTNWLTSHMRTFSGDWAEITGIP